MVLLRKSKILSRQALLVFVLACMLGLPAPAALAQGSSTREITLAELGYDEVVMRGPLSTTRYYFGLPSTWAPQTGGYLALHLSFIASGHESDPPAFLRIQINDTLVHTEDLKPSDNLRLLVYLPAERLLASLDQNINTLRLEFAVEEECERALLVSLTVKDTSFLHFRYRKEPVEADLALYPAPIYQAQTIEQGGLQFILPSAPSGAELEAAAAIAARMGRLTAGQLSLSATLAPDLQDMAPREHLVILGRPDDQPLIHQLALPVPAAERQLALDSNMPAQVQAGEIVSYTLRVGNTSDVTRTLSVEDWLPQGGTLLSCSGPCTETLPGAIRWEIGPLAPGEQVSTTVTVQTDLPDPAPGSNGEPAASTIEHTASLLDEQGNVLNVDTSSVRLVTAPNEELADAQGHQGQAQSAYFFAHGGRGVAEGDGLVQEIVSPWGSDRAAVVVTGLDDAALLKAARALSSDNHFPGMRGAYALVQATHPVSESIRAPVESRSLASLGYEDDSIGSLYLEYLEYRFPMPAGWELGEDAYLALHFAHGTALNDIEATMEVQLNGLPVGSLRLDESNTFDGWTAIPLAASAIRTGTNRIRLQVSADQEHICEYITSDRYWLTVFADSFLHLPRQTSGLVLGLDQLPYPFANHPNLEDVVFLLPEQPTPMEVEGLLRLAFQMGGAAGGNDFAPRVALGGEPETDAWIGYHLVSLGVPTENAYLAAANDDLPQGFHPGTDQLLQEIDGVIYRLSADESLGSLQELFSPWDPERGMLAITGTNDEGIHWALEALLAEEIRATLSGNLASVHEGRAWSIDTRQATPEELALLEEQIGRELLGTDISTGTPPPTSTAPPTETQPPPTAAPTQPPSATPIPIASPTPALLTGVTTEPAPVPAGSAQPPWLIPLMAASALTIVVAAGVTIWQSRR
jgi:hypothetical protein